MNEGCHPSHKTRISDASSFDEICTVCGATDIVGGGWGMLAYPCPGAKKKEMTEDEKHEALGAMIHRGLVEERTNTRDHHKAQKEALDVAIEALEAITSDPDNWSDQAEEAFFALKKIRNILK